MIKKRGRNMVTAGKARKMRLKRCAAGLSSPVFRYFLLPPPKHDFYEEKEQNNVT
jgi:hypothetical protein